MKFVHITKTTSRLKSDQNKKTVRLKLVPSIALLGSIRDQSKTTLRLKSEQSKITIRLK